MTGFWKNKKSVYGILGVVMMTALVLFMPDIVPAATRVTYKVPGGKLYFEPDTGTIAWAEGDMEELTIPEEINGIKVNLIGRWKLSGLKKLKKINLPKNRNVLGEGSLAELTALEEFSIPEGYETIPNQCFYGCTSLKKISLPSSVTEIEDMAFYKCSSLEYVDIPGNCAHIGRMAFYSCTSLKGVAFVQGSDCDVTDWGIFGDCASLEKVVNIPSVRLKMFYESGKRAEKWLDDPEMNQKSTDMWRLKYGTDTDTKIRIEGTQLKEREDAIRALSQQVTEGCTTDREKIMAVMNWITEKLEYEKGHDNHPWAVYTGIKEVEAGLRSKQLNSCGGYSNMTQVMLQSLGIPCATLWREDRNGETVDHEFCAAYFEGKWRWLDTTHSDNRKEGLEFDVSTPGFFFNSDHRVDYLLYRTAEGENIYKELPLTIPVEEDVKDWPDQNPSDAYVLGQAAIDQDWVNEVDPAVRQAESEKIAARAAEFPNIAVSDESIFEFDATTGTITGMNTTGVTQINIPQTIGGVTVRAIGDNAMQNLSKLEYLTMPDTITQIGKYAFANNRKLKRIHLSANITELKEGFMQNCSLLDSITIPANVKRLDQSLFRNCDSLEEALFEDYDFKIKVIETDPMGSDNYYATGQADISWYCFAGGSGRALHGLDFHETYIGTKYYKNLQAVNLTTDWRQNIVKIHQSQMGYREGFSPYHLDGSNSKPFKLSNKAVDYEWGHFTEASRFTGYQPATWCRAFIDWTYAMAGVNGYKSTQYQWKDTVYAGEGGTITLEPGDMLGMGKSHWCMVGSVKELDDSVEIWILHGNHGDRMVMDEVRHYDKKTGKALDMDDDDYDYFRAIYKIDFSNIPTRTITLNAGDGTCDVKSRIYCEGAYYGCLPEAVRKDYVFDGWYTEPDGKGKKAYPYRNLGDDVTTLYAHYIYNPKAVKGLSLDRESAKLEVGQQLTIKATIQPSDAENPVVSWRSGNDRIVSVKDGVLKGLKEGKATILARSAEGSYVAYCEVEVVAKSTEGSENKEGSDGSEETSNMKNGGNDDGSESTVPGSKDAQNPAPAKVGTTFTIDGVKYKVTSAKASDPEVSLVKGAAKAKISIPPTVEQDDITYKVTAIDSKAFYQNKKVTRVTGGSNVRTIGKQAFSKCPKLRSLTIEKNVTKISSKCFSGSRKLTALTLKTSKLGKAGVKGSLSGSSVKTVFVKSGNKTQNKKLARSYKKIFTKGNCGRKVRVR